MYSTEYVQTQSTAQAERDPKSPEEIADNGFKSNGKSLPSLEDVAQFE